MKVDTANLEVKNNTQAQRFEVQLGDQIGEIKYQKEGSTYMFTHTEVPREFGGQGIADRMAYVALETAKAEGAKVVPLCPFVSKYLQRHKEYASLVSGD
jgi:predicted GNAT family acetyltransferase